MKILTKNNKVSKNVTLMALLLIAEVKYKKQSARIYCDFKLNVADSAQL